MLRQPSFEDQYSKNSLVNDCSSYIGYEPGVDLDYFTPDFRSNESDTLLNQEDEDFENVGITIKGRKEDDGIFLRLRIADKEGNLDINLYFHFWLLTFFSNFLCPDFTMSNKLNVSIYQAVFEIYTSHLIWKQIQH